MKKWLQALLLVLSFAIAAAARLSMLGWMFIIGLGSVIIIGIFHFILHFYSMNYLTNNGRKSIPVIILSHILYLCIFLFQTDFDDSRSYSVLGYILGIENDFLTSYGSTIATLGLIGYIISSIVIIVNARRDKTKGNNLKYILPSVLLALILPFVLMSVIEANRDLQGTKEVENSGEFNSVSRALKNPEKVFRLKITHYDASLSEFPTKILTLPNLKEIEFNEQNITAIPDDIYKLDSLEVLNLLDNNINVINPAICKCNNLIELRVGGDSILTLPECLKKMKSLRHLSIQSNSVNDLMEELRGFKNLETAHFYLKNGILDRDKLNRIEEETGIHHKY